MLIAPLVFALSIAIAAWDADLAKWSWLLITVISLAQRDWAISRQPQHVQRGQGAE